MRFVRHTVSEQEKTLTDELADLSKQQSEALQTAIYLTMPKGEAKSYDERAKRIGEICSLLSNIRANR